jgi:hypothetical protein
MKKIILTESDKKVIISAKEKAIMESFAKTFNKIKRLDEAEVSPMGAPAPAAAPQQGTSNPQEIEATIAKDVPNLMNNAEITKIANQIMSDPKGIESLKQFMASMGHNVNEVAPVLGQASTTTLPVPDMNFIKNAIKHGVEDGKSMNEEEGSGGTIIAALASFAGGAYIANHFFNPIIEKTIVGASMYTTQFAGDHVHDPLYLGIKAGLAAAVLGVIAYKVAKGLMNKGQ